MAGGMWLLFTLSVLALLLLLAFEVIKESMSKTGRSTYRSLILAAFVAGMAGLITLLITFESYGGHELKGNSAPMNWNMVGLLYATMTAGMLSQYAFFKAPREAFRFTSFVKPVFASPIVFIPLASSYQSALAESQSFGLPELMIALVAFQNGFFWKVIFDKQAQVSDLQHAEQKVGT